MTNATGLKGFGQLHRNNGKRDITDGKKSQL